MKVLNKTDRIAKCKCGCIMEYDETDIIAAVVCTNCLDVVPTNDRIVIPKGNDFDKLSWDEICGTPAELFTLGATKNITLKNGEQYAVQVTHRKGGLMLSFKDLYGNEENGGKAINEQKDYERNYEDCDVRKWLNSEFLTLLPDDLVKHIVPAEIASNSKVLKDKVFIPSEMEVFGKDEYGNCKEGEQLELYADWHNRISGYADGQYGRWWWLRTKSKAGGSYFCGVSGYGCAYFFYVTDSCGVRPHFLIK